MASSNYETDYGIFIGYVDSCESRHMVFIIDNKYHKANILHRNFSLDFSGGCFNIICDADFFIINIPLREAESGEFFKFADSVRWDSITRSAQSELDILRG